MDWRERIVVDSKVLAGKPVIRGTRLSVEFMLSLLAEGWTEQQLIANYPGLAEADIRACLAYAAEALGQEKVYPLPA
jgi:uncharacterized protein (DUF433 family)